MEGSELMRLHGDFMNVKRGSTAKVNRPKADTGIKDSQII